MNSQLLLCTTQFLQVAVLNAQYTKCKTFVSHSLFFTILTDTRKSFLVSWKQLDSYGFFIFGFAFIVIHEH